MRKEKGVSGLGWMQAFITMLFVVGVLVFALAYTSSELQEATTDTTADSVMANFSLGLNTISTNISSWVSLAVVVVIVGIAFTIIYFVTRRTGGAGGM